MSGAWAAILSVLGVAAGSSVLTVIVQGVLHRGREPALIAKLTEQANAQIYASYEGLLRELRNDAEAGRAEVRAARDESRAAMLRAADAEARATSAEIQASIAQTSLREICRLVKLQAPDLTDLLAKFERFLPASEGASSG